MLHEKGESEANTWTDTLYSRPFSAAFKIMSHHSNNQYKNHRTSKKPTEKQELLRRAHNPHFLLHWPLDKEDEMDGACGTHEREEKCMYGFGLKT